MQTSYDIAIIGAGAAGLLAAYELSKAGKKVLLLEARDRIGGRAHTVYTNDKIAIETGAEFVHGQLPVTLDLLKQAGISYHLIEGDMVHFDKGAVSEYDAMGAHWQQLMEALYQLTEDMSIDAFLTHYFPSEKDKQLRQSVIRFVQGFDAADPALASALSLREEWANNDEEHQYRIEGGYTMLMQWLADEAIKHGASIQLSACVQSIKWGKGNCILNTNNTGFTASKVLITIPLAIWQRDSSIQFEPSLQQKKDAALQLGNGQVIKINMLFETNFWQQFPAFNQAGFILSDAVIPTWWTQLPDEKPLLNGWLAGPPAKAFADLSDDAIQQQAISSLAYIFNLSEAFLKEQLVTCIISNWITDPHAGSAYSYETLQTVTARKLLQAPVDNTLFFVGEALYEGQHTGTVEAAFDSALKVMKEML